MKNKGLFIVKQVVGIDIGMDSFYACFKVLPKDGNVIKHQK